MNADPHQFLHSMASGFHHKPILCMISVYLDESGQEEGTVCVVAGFAGNEDQWHSFIDDWRAALGKRKSLHMKELRWKGKKKHRTQRLLERLGPIPSRHGLQRVCSEVRHDDYETIVRPVAKDNFARPWMLAFQVVLLKTLQWLPENETVKFICEDQGTYSPYAEFLHMAVFKARQFDPRLVSIEFVGKGTTPCTEPADYLSFMVREWATDPGSDKAKMGQSILAPDFECIGERFTRQKLKEWADGALGIKMELQNMTAETKKEFEAFDTTMRELLKVPHSQIKASMEAEKKSKKVKKPRKSSASREGA